MDVLIAHGSEASRRRLAKTLGGDGVGLVEAAHGDAALNLLMGTGAPRLALIDWDLPGLEGPELCRLLRDFNLGRPPYIILLSHVGRARDVTAGLEAGANDIVLLPVSAKELRARVEYGRRVVELPWGEPSIDDETETRQMRLAFHLQTT
jgi:DNA-binding response OmpR family regulator